jgi:RNA polymerase sigma-70 factor (ECF subfamily)
VTPPSSVDEAWLVLRAQGGSRDHLERLVVITESFLRPRLGAMIGDPADTDDVLQDVLFTLCRRLRTLNDARLFRPWAHRIATRAAWKFINRRHRAFRRTEPIDDDSLPAIDIEPPAIDVGPLLDRVSPASRIVLMLHYIEGKTLEATAAELGVAPGTVKSRLAYGLRQLRQQLPNEISRSSESRSRRSP